MRRGFSTSYIFIPLAYVSIILGLLFLQFAGGNLFRADFGPLSFTAAFEMGKSADDKLPSSIQLKYSGLGFSFENNKGLQLQSQDDQVRNLKITGFTKLDKGFRVSFEDHVSVDFLTTLTDLGQLSIELNIPANLLPVKAIRMPFATIDGAQATMKPDGNGALVSFQAKEYIFSLPTRSFFDPKNAIIVIPGDSVQKSLRYAEKAQSTGGDLDSLLANASGIVSEKEYDDTLVNFVNNAYNGWKGARYNSGAGTWTQKDGGAKFDEALLVAFLSEAWERNDYPRAYAEMRTAVDIHPDQISYQSSVFMGNLKRVTNEMVENDRRKTAKYLGLIAANDANILLEPGLVLFVSDRGSDVLRTNLKTYLTSLDLTSLNPSQFLGLMRLVYLDPMPDSSYEPLVDKFKAGGPKGFASNISKLDEGVFFASVENKIDSYNSVLAGRILVAMGQRESDVRYTGLGRALIYSVLKQADELGFIPVEFSTSGTSITASPKSRGPEDFYTLCSNNTSYPREVSLFKEVGPGTYYYTIMKVDSQTFKPGEYDFNVSYPRNRTQYIFFAGMPNIDPLTGTQLFGITWRNASDFESYSKGRFFNPDTRILMVKYFDDSSSETIKVWFK